MPTFKHFGRRRFIILHYINGKFCFLHRITSLNIHTSSLLNRFSPGNVWTPLWEDGAKSAENPEAVIQAGKDAQVCKRFQLISMSLPYLFSAGQLQSNYRIC